MNEIETMLNQIKMLNELIDQIKTIGEEHGISTRDSNDLDGIKTRLQRKIKKQTKALVSDLT